MDTWTILLSNSTAPVSADAWTHLNSQEGGGCDLVYVLDSIGVEQQDEIISVEIPEQETVDVDTDLISVDVTKDDEAVTATEKIINIDVDKCP